MNVKPGTLVVVFPENGYPPQECLGIAEEPVGADHFWVKIDKMETERGLPLPKRISVRTSFLCPMADFGEVLRRRSVRTQLVKQAPDTLLGFALKIHQLSRAQRDPVEIGPGDLVIVMRAGSDNQGGPAWGIVMREMPGGKFDITLGPEPMSLVRAATAKVKSGVRFLGRRGKQDAKQTAEPVPRLKTFATAEELLLFARTGDNSIVDVNRAVVKNIACVLWVMALHLAQIERKVGRSGPG